MFMLKVEHILKQKTTSTPLSKISCQTIDFLFNFSIMFTSLEKPKNKKHDIFCNCIKSGLIDTFDVKM